MSFDPREIADWFRGQRKLVAETGCGYKGWFGISTSRAGAPVPVVQYGFPILLTEGSFNEELCGTFLGVCAAGIALPSDHAGCDIAIEPIVIDDDSSVSTDQEEVEDDGLVATFEGVVSEISLSKANSDTARAKAAILPSEKQEAPKQSSAHSTFVGAERWTVLLLALIVAI